MSKAFRWYARTYGVEIVDSKDPLSQLQASKSSIEGLFKDLLDEFARAYFNFTTKTVINLEYDLEKSFRKILYKIDNWINEGCG